jgi:hypothetical protein
MILSANLCFGETHYFTTTYAGTVPPIANPVALKQYLDAPIAVAYDAHGNLYYANYAQIWRLNPKGTDTLIAGTTPGVKGGNSGLATDATFFEIRAMAFDAQGNLYIADYGFWKMTPDGKIASFAGPTNAYFNSLFEQGTFTLAIDASGNLYAAGFDSGAIMKYSTATEKWTSFALLSSFDIVNALAVSGHEVICAGQCELRQRYAGGSANGSGLYGIYNLPQFRFLVGPRFRTGWSGLRSLRECHLHGQSAIRCSGAYCGSNDRRRPGGRRSGHPGEPDCRRRPLAPGALAVSPVNGDIAFTEPGYHVVRTIGGATKIIQTVAGAQHFGGDNGPAILALFDASDGFGELAADAAGNLYLADRTNARIRKITPSGIVTTIAGSGVGVNSGDEGKATHAEISAVHIAADKAGNVYFINSGAFDSVRMVDLNGIIHTVAGGGTAPVTNGAPANSVALAGLYCLAVGPSGDLYFGQNQTTYPASGTMNTNEILKVSSGNISIVAGASLSSFPVTALAPDGTPAAGANIEYVGSVAVDNNGLVYSVEESGTNGRIRMVDAKGNLATIAGIVTTQATLSPLVPGPAKTTQLDAPSSLTFDSANNLYFANFTLNMGPQVAVIDASGTLTPIAGMPSYTSYETTSGDGDSLQASFASLLGLALDPSGNIFMLDSGVYIRKLSPYNPASPPPYLSAGGVIGAGASVPAVAAVSPNGDASIYGADFGVMHTLTSADLVNGKGPTILAGVCASFAGVPAAILGVYPGQVNVQVPAFHPAR